VNMHYVSFESIVTVVTGVGQCVYDALADTAGGQPDRYCPLVPGAIAWDKCECGQLAQSIDSSYPSSAFPVAANETPSIPCGTQLVVFPVRLSLTRCVHGPSAEDQRAPKCDRLLADALVLEEDRWVVRRAITCCLQVMGREFRIANFAVGAATSVGPQGSCGGVELTYLVGLGSTCCG